VSLVLRLMVGMYHHTFQPSLLSFLFIPLQNYIIWNKKSTFPDDKLSYIFTIFFIRYTFCGLAALILIGEANRLDLPRLLVRELLFFAASH